MDEPFSALDPISRNSLQELVLSLHEELGTTIVFVTHNMEEAIKLGDRIAFMKDGEIIQCDTPEQLLMNPKNEYVRHFFDEPKQTKEWRVEDLVVMGTLKEVNTLLSEAYQGKLVDDCFLVLLLKNIH